MKLAMQTEDLSVVLKKKLAWGTVSFPLKDLTVSLSQFTPHDCDIIYVLMTAF